MKKLNKIWLLMFLAIVISGCEDELDLEPTDKITADELFADPDGTQLYLADLYNRLPMEDATFFPREGFNQNVDVANNGGYALAMFTDEAVHSEWGGEFVYPTVLHWWDQAYELIRDVNLFIEIIPTLDVSDEQKQIYLGEAAFIRAYSYFALAKRYGGVPILTEAQTFEGDLEALMVPRNTEEETWDFVLAECDIAIENLGDADPNARRASRWVAYALKSRAALFAASVAKFGDKAPLSGDAVTAGLVGLESGLANDYYQASIEASEAIMTLSPYSLYKPNPDSPEEAAENYREMFENPNLTIGTEAILIKGRAIPGSTTGTNYDIWYTPAQLANGWPHPGRMNPTLDLVDVYESYDNPGESSPIVTTTDGNVDDYSGFSSNKDYLRFSNPEEIFEGKDARLWGTVVLPGTEFKGTEIIIQGGYIAPNGEATLLSNAQIEVDGNTYYTYGGPSPSAYSGFDPFGGNNTKTGFSFKKFLTTDPVIPGWNRGTTDWSEFRYAEILLNYAEAVAESGLGDEEMAREALNAVRSRAAHEVEIPLTVENVMRERLVELAFENKRFWDLIRRREYHEEFENRTKHALVPVLDLRVSPPQYIFIRQPIQYYPQKTFEARAYYRPIQGIGNNNLIQNPQY